MIGAVQYNIAATTGLADNFPRVYAAWSATTYQWASTIMYTWGGGFFLISGVCYILLDMGISGIWLGKSAVTIRWFDIAEYHAYVTAWAVLLILTNHQRLNQSIRCCCPLVRGLIHGC